MATRTGKPYSTDWKSYQLPWTRLEVGSGLTTKTEAGAMGVAGQGLDVYINDDAFFLDSKVPNGAYAFGMTHHASVSGGDFIGATSGKWTSNAYFTGGTPGAIHDTRKMRLGTPADADDRHGKALINVVSPEVETVHSLARGLVGSTGNTQEIITVEPGLHIGFQNTSHTIYGDDAKTDIVLDYDYISKLPKQQHSVYTCWMYVPENSGDVTESLYLPSELQLNSFNIIVNPMRFGPKQLFSQISTTKDFGLTVGVETKPRGSSVWSTNNTGVITGSTDLDYSIGDIDVFTAAVHRSGLGQGGERQQDMKITLTFPDISLSPAIMTPAQHLQVVLIPH
tara:strand:+ start:2835 stop:3848 length:1014 start_codon:yes stop_codon:yes gene_type:complete